MKLLNKTIQSYLIYSSIILLIAVPVFYFIIQHIVSRDVDVRLNSQKAELLGKIERLPAVNSFGWLEVIEPDIHFMLSQDMKQYDTLYTATLLDIRFNKIVPYRILETNVTVKNIRYKIQFKSSLISNEKLIKSIVLVQFLLMLMIATGLLLINQRLSRSIWLPFYQTLQKLQHYKIEDEGQLHFSKTDIDEFTNLNNTISALTKRNEDVYQSQKEFTENAAHEMQSPLAVFQVKTELLMQTAHLSQEQADLISDLASAGQRMNRLNKSLLLLSKIDNYQFSHTESVDIAELLTKVLKQFNDSIKQKEIRLTVQKIKSVILVVNKTLLEVMMGNLLSNAIRHNIFGGILAIFINEEEMIIQNTGKASSLDTDKLFKRFQKQTTDLSSSGLGLEIVKKICVLNGFVIHYSYDHQLHTFTVKF